MASEMPRMVMLYIDIPRTDRLELLKAIRSASDVPVIPLT